jgi:hypothetical protein
MKPSVTSVKSQRGSHFDDRFERTFTGFYPASNDPFCRKIYLSAIVVRDLKFVDYTWKPWFKRKSLF